MPQIFHKDWNTNEHATGRFKAGKPIIGAIFQNGLNDQNPDGSFVPCDMGLDAIAEGVTTHRVKRGRYGELRFADSASSNKHLCKIKYKDGKGLSFKYLSGESDLPDVSNGKPSFTSNNGITIEHTPTYKGVRIELVINDPLTAPTEHTFSMKTYGQNYTYMEQDGGIVARGEDLKPITIHAPYAVDANGDVGPVSMVLAEVIGGYQEFKKVVDETWLRQAAAPVRIDPNITIEDGVDGGVIEDASINNNPPLWDYNFGANTSLEAVNGDAGGFLIKVDLSSYDPNLTVINAYFEGNAYWPNPSDLVWYGVLRDWNEGNKTFAAASVGEVTTRSARHGEQLWSVLGCAGAGTDRLSVADGSKAYPGPDANFQFPLTSGLVESWLGVSSNGIVVNNTGSSSFYLYSSEHGSKPSFYMEYTEGAEGWHPNSFYGNRRVRF